MIRLYVNNQPLYLKPDLTIRLDFIFPQITEDKIQTGYVEWFEIPYVSTNIQILNYAFSIYVKGVYIYDAILDIHAVQLAGKLIVKESNKAFGKASFVMENTPETFKDKLISEYQFETINTGASTQDKIDFFNNQNSMSYPSAIVALPYIGNQIFYGENQESNKDYQIFMNGFDFVNTTLKRNSINKDLGPGYTNPDVPDNITTLIPMPYLLTVMDKMVESWGYKLSGNFKKNTDIQKIIIYNNTSLDYIYSSFDIADLYLTDEYPILAQINKIILLESSDEFDVYDYQGNYTARFYSYYKVVADFQIKMFGYGTFKIHYGLRNLNNDWILYTQLISTINNEYIYLSIDNNVFIETTQWLHFSISITNEGGNKFLDGFIKELTLRIDPISKNSLNSFSDKLNIKNHLPEISTSDFLNNICKFFFVVPFFNDSKKIVEFEFVKNIVNGNCDYIDLSNEYIADSELITHEKKYYSITMNWENDEFAKGNFKKFDIEKLKHKFDINRGQTIPDKQIGDMFLLECYNVLFFAKYWDEKKEVRFFKYADNFYDIENKLQNELIETNIGTLIMMWEDDYSLYPKIHQVGSSDYFDIGKNEPGFKLLYYYGMCKNAKNQYYPFSSSQNMGNDGSKVAEFALRLNDEDGIYNVLMKDYCNYMGENGKVTMKFNVSVQKFMQIANLFKAQSEGKKVRNIKVNSKIFRIPAKFSFIVGMNGINECEAELY